MVVVVGPQLGSDPTFLVSGFQCKQLQVNLFHFNFNFDFEYSKPVSLGSVLKTCIISSHVDAFCFFIAFVSEQRLSSERILVNPETYCSISTGCRVKY